MALMTYNTMSEEYTENMLNQTLNKTHKKHVHALTISLAKKKKMLKEVPEVEITLEYPFYGEFKHHKKGQPRRRY